MVQQVSTSLHNLLSTRFVEHYRYNRAKPKTIDHLFNIQQNERELVKEYVTRVHQVVEEIEDIATIKAITRGISPTKRCFFNYITWHSLYTKSHLFVRCEKYLTREDEYTIRCKKVMQPYNLSRAKTMTTTIVTKKNMT